MMAFKWDREPRRMTHVPVMLNEVLDAIGGPRAGIVVDATFGGGGYSRAFLEAGAKVIAFDRDPEAERRALTLACAFPTQFSFQRGRFSEIARRLRAMGAPAPHAMVFDIGVSSFQIDEAERGFSFQADGPLDMRMGRVGPSAADAVNHLSEADLADLFYHYGEERNARRIAKTIVAARALAPIATTLQLAQVIESVQPRKAIGPHPATRCFQALRIFVNQELDELGAGLAAAEAMLAPGGVLIVVSFHSLEDRMVKQFLADAEGRSNSVSRHVPTIGPAAAPIFVGGRSAIAPSPAEIAANPRARSAKMRVAERTQAPARLHSAPKPEGPALDLLRRRA